MTTHTKNNPLYIELSDKIAYIDQCMAKRKSITASNRLNKDLDRVVARIDEILSSLKTKEERHG